MFFIFLDQPHNSNLSQCLYVNGNLPDEELMRLYPFSWEVVNAEEVLATQEPEAGALAAVFFKLTAGEAFLSTQADLQLPIMVLASDVEFHVDIAGKGRQSQRRLDRQELTVEAKEEAKKALVSAYTQGPFAVSWVVTFAAQSQVLNEQGQVVTSQPKVMELELEAEFAEGLSESEIETNFLPSSNSWLRLIELAAGRAQLRIKNKHQAHEDYKPISPEFAQILIARKVLPPRLYLQLLNEWGQEEEYYDEQTETKQLYRQVVVSLLGLA